MSSPKEQNNRSDGIVQSPSPSLVALRLPLPASSTRLHWRLQAGFSQHHPQKKGSKISKSILFEKSSSELKRDSA